MNKIKVLIVEDEVLIANDLRMTLEDHNFSVINVVRSGEDAIISATTTHPDLILMDIRLSGDIDGITATERIREQSEVPVIYLSDHVDEQTVGRAKHTYPANYLSKPFNENDLLRALEIAFFNTSKRSNNISSKNCMKDRIFIRTQNQTSEMIFYSDILYLKAGGSYSTIVTTTKEYILSSNLKQVIEQFDHPDFIRVHRGYSANISHIKSIEGNIIMLEGGHRIQMSNKFKEAVLKNFKLIK